MPPALSRLRADHPFAFLGVAQVAVRHGLEAVEASIRNMGITKFCKAIEYLSNIETSAIIENRL